MLTAAPKEMGTIWQDRDFHIFVRRSADDLAQGFTLTR